jgi:hypothetical protein
MCRKGMVVFLYVCQTVTSLAATYIPRLQVQIAVLHVKGSLWRSERMYYVAFTENALFSSLA